MVQWPSNLIVWPRQGPGGCKGGFAAARIAGTLVLLFLGAGAGGTRAMAGQQAPGLTQDEVWVRSPEGGDPVKRLGVIRDYTGDGLVLEGLGGRQTTIPPEQIVRIQTQRTPRHESADRMFADGDYRAALTRYRQALDEEPRLWVRREVLARMVLCYRRLGQWQQAAETFAVLVQSDPKTIYYYTIPLVWNSSGPPPSTLPLARRWINSPPVPAAALMAASWLLSDTRHRSQAQDRLKELAGGDEEPVALLAAAQLWRIRLPLVTDAELTQWRDTLFRLAGSLRAGPLLVWARAAERLGRYEEAALAAMQIVILYEEGNEELAPEALWLAHRCLTQLGRRDEAASVLMELIQRYPDSEAARAVQGTRHEAR